MKKKKTKKQKKQNYTKTDWVLFSEDWRDTVITYVPELNDVPMEDNYADISQEEISCLQLQYQCNQMDDGFLRNHLLGP